MAVKGDAGVMVFVDDRAVQRSLNALEVALAGPSLHGFLTHSVEPYLRTRAKARFAGEGDDVVGKWAPLMPYTEAIRASKGYGPAHPINRRTGALENFITQGTNEFHTGPLDAALFMPGRNASPEMKRKIATAQVGRSLPDTVARPVLGMNQTDLIEVMVTLGGFVAEAVRRGS